MDTQKMIKKMLGKDIKGKNLELERLEEIKQPRQFNGLERLEEIKPLPAYKRK